MMRPFVRSFFALLPALGLLLTAQAQEAQSSFGHARTREAAELGRLPTPLEVAVADIVNYHRHRLPLPRDEQEVMLQLRFGNAEARPGELVVLQCGYTTAPGDDRADLPPLNLALVIDRSGSMAEANKLAAVKRALDAFVGMLRPADRVALVTYDSEPRLDQPSRTVDGGRWLRTAIAGLEPGGATNLHGGLMLGLREVSAHARADTSNRVLLLTDGIANRGETDPERILAAASSYTAEDVDLSTIGVGQNLDVALLDRLARGGRGLFHYVADAQDIDKVFVQEHEALVAPVARRVRLELEVPAGLRLERVVGHEFRSEGGGRIAVDLPNQNRGATGVVILVCRARTSDHDARSVRVHGALHYLAGARKRSTAADEGLQIVGDRFEEGGDDGRHQMLRDPEVRKNYTIAVLAEGMHEMAKQAACRRWASADSALRAALRFSREQFASDDDVDVRRVRDMAEAYARTLARYVDRFQDI